ncbi:unnamed protein product, partial [Rotaria magnacalcarata]
MWSEYCKTLNICDVKQFWRKSRRHFSSCAPPIHGFIQNNGIITSSMEMCDT